VTVQLGAAHVDRVEEQQFPVPFALLADDFGAVSRWIEPLPGGFLDSSAMTFQFVNQSWLIRADGLTVLVDPCNGNWRRRRVPYFNHRDLPWLEHLHAAGAAPEDIDVVFSTHLHNDHCGWNTNWAGDRWVPTFSSARYLFVEAEYQPSWPRGAAVPRRRVPVFPAHFPAPHYGQVSRDGDEYVFVPASAP
jgi:glyoxylase-like metal-dependent hydrolase (beta-lactamase superfamily II)